MLMYEFDIEGNPVDVDDNFLLSIIDEASYKLRSTGLNKFDERFFSSEQADDIHFKVHAASDKIRDAIELLSIAKSDIMWLIKDINL